MPLGWTFVGNAGRTVGEPVVGLGQIFPVGGGGAARESKNVNWLWLVLVGRTKTLADMRA